MTIARVRRSAVRCATSAASLAVCGGMAVAAAPSAAGAPADTGRNILIADGRFVPADIGVLPGTTVVWTNTDEVQHNVQSTEAPQHFGTSDGGLRNGQSYRFTFTKRGIYHFVCWLNGNMYGSITVGDRAFTAPPADDSPENPFATPLPLPTHGPNPSASPRPHR
jgi:plastocyanin